MEGSWKVRGSFSYLGVEDDEEQVEAREQAIGQPDVLHGGAVGVVLSVDGVGGGDDGAAGVERGVDPRLGDGDGLLLHDLIRQVGGEGLRWEEEEGMA